jgi:hypothetical protein
MSEMHQVTASKWCTSKVNGKDSNERRVRPFIAHQGSWLDQVQKKQGDGVIRGIVVMALPADHL